MTKANELVTLGSSHHHSGMKQILKHSILFLFLLSFCISAKAQSNDRHYNVDSLLRQLSKNTYINKTLKRADAIYKQARVSKTHISTNAFRIAYLEKCFLDSGLIQVQLPKDSMTIHYSNTNILTVIDFTKKGNQKRFITIDIARQKIVHNTLVSHGTATGNGIETLTQQYNVIKANINGLKDIPTFFGNGDSSYRSSLGLVLTVGGDAPDNPCHVCKYFLSKPHQCNVLLEGLEAGINDNDRKREIIIHTTGSRDFSDSLSTAKIAVMIDKSPDSLQGLYKKDCKCIAGPKRSSSYASACAIAENNGFIGRSSGCFVLPEEIHLPIMETIRNGTLIFVYSNIIAPTSTNYFEESPAIKAIIKFAEKNGSRTSE